MIIVPYSAELRLARKPWVTFAIMLLCLLVFLAEQGNRRDTGRAAYDYCEAIHNENQNSDQVDYITGSLPACIHDLLLIHDMSDVAGFRGVLEKYSWAIQKLDETVRDQAFDRVWHHYDAFSLDAPRSLDAKLNYDPSSLNPVNMLTSAFSHGDWLHLLGNLLFFFAFAPAVELLIGGALRYIGVFVTIEIVGGLVYSAVCYASGDFRPTLGLSGFVMGIIGLSAYLMPGARIRTFFWFVIVGKTFYVPAFLLAAWYIGLDIYYLFAYSNSGGVNLVAHVAGGVTGFLLGMLWFKARRNETREALDDEITYMRENRPSFFVSKMAAGARGDRAKIDNEYLVHENRRQHNRHIDSLYNMVKTGQDSTAIALYCQDYDEGEGAVEFYAMLFDDMEHWKRGRSWLCLGRLLINLYVAKRQVGKAMKIARRCIAETEYFVIGDPAHVLYLAREAGHAGDAELALALLFKAGARYGQDINIVQCVLEEARLLWLHRDDTRQALAKLAAVKNIATGHDLDQVDELLLQLKSSS